MDKNFCVIITSVIYCVDKELSYSSSRSVFSSEERLSQTIETIKSIRNKIPNVKIILIEQGGKDIPQFHDLVDKYLYIGKNYFINKTTNSKLKSLGEASALIFSSPQIFSLKSDFYIKISGRYFLNDSLDLSNWNLNKFNFRENSNNLLTVLYGFPKKYSFLWLCFLLIAYPLLLTNRSIEAMLCLVIPKKFINYLNNLGVSGYDSCEGKLFVL